MIIRIVFIFTAFIGFLFSENQKSKFKVEGMMCETGCAWKVESVVKSIEGINVVKVDFENKVLFVEYDKTKINDNKIIEALSKETTYTVKKVEQIKKSFIPLDWIKKITNS